MLNEILEYEQYTDPGHKKRLSAKLITDKGLAGVPRALTIIARKELDDRNYWKEKKPENRKIIRYEVTDALKRWCFEDNEMSLLQRINIPEPKKNTNETDEEYETKKEKLSNNITEKTIKSLEVKKQPNSWSSEDIYFPLNFRTPNIYAVNFPRIMSSAISCGPLKQYMLVCNKVFFEDLYTNRFFSVSIDNKDKKVIPVFTKKNDPVKGKLIDNYRDHIERLLKLIAIYMYNLSVNHDGKTPVYIGSGEAANWMEYPSFCIGNHSTTFYYKYNNMDEHIPVFENRYGFWEMNKIIENKYGFMTEEYKEKKEEEKENGYRTMDKKNNRCMIYDLKDGLRYPGYEEFSNK